MQSGLGWKFMAGAPRPVVRPAQPQHPLQPVLELSDSAGIEAVARGFFTESPAPIAAEVNPRASYRQWHLRADQGTAITS